MARNLLKVRDVSLSAFVMTTFACAAAMPDRSPARPEGLLPGDTVILPSRTGPELDEVLVRPEEIDDVLVNPGMGIQTFQRFNRQALNPGLEWSEEGPLSVLPDQPTPPDFPGSSIAYCRWFWSSIEPERGRYRWDILDLALAQARAHHQRLAIRLMPYDPKHPLPAWYRSSGARRANKPSDPDGAIFHPDFSDPLYLEAWGKLVSLAGARYDGNPSLDTVDISSIGYWGEGQSDHMPAFEHQKQLIEIWLDAFERTPLLMNFDEPAALTYATRKGAGWRLDCLGDMRSIRTAPSEPYRWSHMLDQYPQQVVRAQIQDVWRTRPVSLETCWVPGYWKQQGWNVDYILNQALRWHLSSLNIKSSRLPPGWKEAFDELQKKMGYRFILRRLQYRRVVRAGESMPIHMWWLNAGVAPIYREHALAVELRSSAGSAIVHIPVDVRTWLPGDAIFDGEMTIPANLGPGVYRLRVAMLDPATDQPAIRFAIRGRQADGWYDLGAIAIE